MIQKHYMQGRFYGQEYVETDYDIQQRQLQQQYEEEKAKYIKKMSKYTLVALVLSAVLFAETLFIGIYSTPYPMDIVTIAGLFIVALVLITGYSIFISRIYKNKTHDLSFNNMTVIIVAQIVFMFFQGLLTASNIPMTFFTFAGCVIGFIIYLFVASSLSGKVKGAIIIAGVVSLLVASASYNHPCNYQPKYLYLSTSSYDTDTMTKNVKSAHNVDYKAYSCDNISSEELDKAKKFGSKLMDQGIIDSTEKLKEVCDLYNSNISADISRFDLYREFQKLNNYDDNYFKENALFFTCTNLNANNDYTIEDSVRVSRWSTSMDIKNYLKNSYNVVADEDKNLTCIIVNEIPKSDAEVMINAGGISSKSLNTQTFSKF